jgi:hypothetical protein
MKKEMRFKFRLHDRDMPALTQAETILRRLSREFGFDVEIWKVNEGLEHGRMGVSGMLPALEINGIIVTRKTPLDEENLRQICKKLFTLFSGEKLPSKKVDNGTKKTC